MAWIAPPIPDTLISAEQQDPALRYKYNVSPLGRHSNARQILSATYQKSPLGRHPSTGQILKATYQKSPLGQHSTGGVVESSRSVGKGVDTKQMIKNTYHPINAGNFSRMSRIIAAAGAAT